jgi:His/Glu/Gln/Arg/opine family amino acid ABC transporter permease subunit
VTVLAFDFNWDVVVQRQDLLWAGVRYTLWIATVAMALSLVLGLVVAMLRLSRFPPLAWLAAAYINVFRAIPLFVFIIYVYYGVSIAVGINFQPITAGIIALTLQYAAWMAEIFRSGIQAVPKGQREAALSLGMGRPRVFASIVLPQALRIVIPPTGNMFVGMVKDSSLVSIIGVAELVRTTQLLVSQTFRPFEFYTAAVLFYLAITLGLSYGMRLLERRLALEDPRASRRRSRGLWARRRLRRLQALQALAGGGAAGGRQATGQ